MNVEISVIKNVVTIFEFCNNIEIYNLFSINVKSFLLFRDTKILFAINDNILINILYVKNIINSIIYFFKNTKHNRQQSFVIVNNYRN